MSIRYVPIPPTLFRNLSGLQQNVSAVTNISIELQRAANYISPSMDYHQISSELIEVLLITLTLLLIAIIVLLYFKSGYGVHGTTSIVLGRREFHENFPRVNYVYRGVKSVLRKYFTMLRKRFGCSTCTPREISLKLGLFRKFAEVYEDVVYGDKQRLDVDEALQEVRKAEE
jgi:hypothetical protein